MAKKIKEGMTKSQIKAVSKYRSASGYPSLWKEQRLINAGEKWDKIYGMGNYANQPPDSAFISKKWEKDSTSFHKSYAPRAKKIASEYAKSQSKNKKR